MSPPTGDPGASWQPWSWRWRTSTKKQTLKQVLNFPSCVCIRSGGGSPRGRRAQRLGRQSHHGSPGAGGGRPGEAARPAAGAQPAGQVCPPQRLFFVQAIPEYTRPGTQSIHRFSMCQAAAGKYGRLLGDSSRLVQCKFCHLCAGLVSMCLACRSAEIREKCVRHHIDASVLALRDAVWSIITGAQASRLRFSETTL